MSTTRMSTSDSPRAPEPRGEERRFETQLAAWTAAGLISADQARRLREAERDARATRERARSSLVPEALGYLGGVVVVVGAALLADRFWSDLGTTWRLVVLGLAAVGLVTAGAFVPRAAGPPMSAGQPVPGNRWRPLSCTEIVITRGSFQKARSTPSPWWTSMST